MVLSVYKHLTRLLLISSAMLFTANAFGQDVIVTHCDGACPQYESSMATTRANVVIHHVYAAGLNGDTGLADWVSYRLTKDAIGVASLLPRIWQPDRLLEFSSVDDVLEITTSELRLAEVAVSNNPYAGLGELPEQVEESARLAPMTSFANTPYWNDLNNLTNMVPMPKPLRLGPWLQLEQRLNALVMKTEELQVITGPLFLISNFSRTPTTTSIEPAAYFKIVAHDDDFVAFVFPKDLGQFESYCGHVADIDQLEEMVSINFFPDRLVQESEQLLADLNCVR